MITLHFHLQPQYKYEVFHINFTSFHCTGRYELNKLTSLPMCGFVAQLVEHRTGIAEVTGSNPVEALIFFQASSFQLLKLEIYCDDHSSLSQSLVLLRLQFFLKYFVKSYNLCILLHFVILKSSLPIFCLFLTNVCRLFDLI